MVLSIIIVSYNTKDLTVQTIQSVFESVATQHPSATLRTSAASLPVDKINIFVVDNNSTDGSVETLRNTFGNKITLIERKTNDGFAAANNVGIQFVIDREKDRSKTCPYILLLNSDTIAQPNALQHLLLAMDANPSYGILSCRLVNPDGSYQPQGGALPTLFNVAAWWLWPLPGVAPVGEPYQDSRPTSLPDTSASSVSGVSPDKLERDFPVREVGWVGGTAMLIRKEVIDQIGGLDEKIFMYAEDVDYCLRATQAGWKVGLVPDTTIIHIGSASGSSAKAKLGEIKGLLYLFGKHKGAGQQMILRVVFMLGAALRYLLFGILRGDGSSRELYRKIIQRTLSATTQ